MFIVIKDYLEENGFILADSPDSFNISQKKFCLNRIELRGEHGDSSAFLLSTHPFHYAEALSLLESSPGLALEVLDSPNFKEICNPASGTFTCTLKRVSL